MKDDVCLEYDLKYYLDSTLISKDSLKEILFELIINANNAIEGKGVINISTQKIYLSTPEDVGLEYFINMKSGNYLHLIISDTGTGISDEIKDNVFDPFFTTNEFSSSSGMGLASVYGLVKLNKGYINFYPNGEKGTVFNIYLPVLEENKKHP